MEVHILSLRRMLLAVFFLEIGALLIVVPWTSFWDQNVFIESSASLQRMLNNHFVRGAVSGLGVINLGVAVLEMISLLRNTKLLNRIRRSILFCNT
ncbi:uncharacterized protein METZ01_LOCUS243834, partial [marine metagenome]